MQVCSTRSPAFCSLNDTRKASTVNVRTEAIVDGLERAVLGREVHLGLSAGPVLEFVDLLQKKPPADFLDPSLRDSLPSIMSFDSLVQHSLDVLALLIRVRWIPRLSVRLLDFRPNPLPQRTRPHRSRPSPCLQGAPSSLECPCRADCQNPLVKVQSNFHHFLP